MPNKPDTDSNGIRSSTPQKKNTQIALKLDKNEAVMEHYYKIIVVNRREWKMTKNRPKSAF